MSIIDLANVCPQACI